MNKKIFVTATDTDAGKTFVTSRLIKLLLDQGVNASAIKPVASGIDARGSNEDVALLLQAQNLREANHINLYTFKLPASPNIAAAAEGKNIDPGTLVEWCHRQAGKSDLCLIEGVGGLMVPLHGRYLVRDWLSGLKPCEVMLVIGARLGCINHALLTLQELNRLNMAPEYIVINAIDGSDVAEQASLSLRPFIPSDTPFFTIPNHAGPDDFQPLINQLMAKN